MSINKNGDNTMYARILAALVATVMSGLIFTAHAQEFPTKPLKMVIPFPPGGAGDITTRILADTMSKGLGQPVIVDNRPGAGAVTGYEFVARAPADGYTILVVFPSFVINPAIRTGLSYDPIKDFQPIGQSMWLPMAIVVGMNVPATSLKELIALARSKPGEIAYGTPGVGTTHHVATEMFRLAVGINIFHAPYAGGVPALTALAGGHLPMAVTNVTEAAPFAKSGRARVLAVTSAERAATLPDVPTLKELGYPELVASNWSGLVVPKGTPPAVITRLNAELVRALSNQDVQDKFKANDMFPLPGTPQQFAQLLQSEAIRFAKVAKEAGVKAN